RTVAAREIDGEPQHHRGPVVAPYRQAAREHPGAQRVRVEADAQLSLLRVAGLLYEGAGLAEQLGDARIGGGVTAAAQLDDDGRHRGPQGLVRRIARALRDGHGSDAEGAHDHRMYCADAERAAEEAGNDDGAAKQAQTSRGAALEYYRPTSGRHRKALSYRAAGVDIDAGDALVERIKPAVERTRRSGMLGGLGGFGGLFEIP